MSAPPARDRAASRDVEVIGVLGGMGPAATATFMQRLVESVPAGTDQDHPRVIVDSNSRIPDRTAALCAGGEDPTPELLRSLSTLEQAGADIVVMPCVTAHAFLPTLLARSSLPFLDLLELVGEFLDARPEAHPAAILATDGTLRTGLLQRQLKRRGVAVTVPDAAEQQTVMEAIRATKAGRVGEAAAFASEVVGAIAPRAGSIVLGCTELSLLGLERIPDVLIVDPLTLLANAAARAFSETE